MSTEPGGIRNGGLAVVSALAAHGVDTVFGIPGTHNLELYRHLPARGIRAVTTRHEQGAGYAADGWALMTGRPGVVLTTSGPGLTNVLTAAATAYAESRPLLLLSPGPPTGAEHADAGTLHETRDSHGMAAAALGAAYRPRTAEAAAEAVTRAFARFRTRRPRPVHIEIPLDVLEGPWHGEVPEPADCTVPLPPQSAVRRAAAALCAARSPLLLAGGGTRRAGTELRLLTEALDAPLVTTANGKGVLDESHPLAVGASVRFPSVQQASREADVLLVMGSELGDSDLWGGTIGAPPAASASAAETSARPGSTPAASAAVDTASDSVSHRTDAPGMQTVIRCDVDPEQLHKNLAADVPLLGDTAACARALLQELERNGAAAAPAADGPETTDTARADTPGAARARALRARADAEFDASTLGARVTALVQEAAGPEIVVAGDSSRVTYDGAVHALRAQAPDQLLYMPGFATLGYGIPAALGAKLAAPHRRVVCVVGDGAAMFSVQEIMTAAELGLAIPFVVVDNGGYEEIEHQMDARGIAPFAVRLRTPDFAGLGRAMGAHGITLEEAELADEFSRALTVALEAARPTVIHVRAAAR